jgi:hypothetical protein
VAVVERMPFFLEAGDAETGRAACLHLSQKKVSELGLKKIYKMCHIGYPPSPDGLLGSW